MLSMQTPGGVNYNQIEEKIFMVRKLLWSALFASLAFYAAVGFMLRGQLSAHPIIDSGSEAALYSNLRIGLLCLAAAHLWLAGAIRGKGENQRTTGTAPRTFRVPDAAWEQLTEEQRMTLGGLKKRLTTEVVAWALSEAAGIYGFVLFFLFGSFDDLLLFIGIAVIGFVLYRPKTLSRQGIRLSS